MCFVSEVWWEECVLGTWAISCACLFSAVSHFPWVGFCDIHSITFCCSILPYPLPAMFTILYPQKRPGCGLREDQGSDCPPLGVCMWGMGVAVPAWMSVWQALWPGEPVIHTHASTHSILSWRFQSLSIAFTMGWSCKPFGESNFPHLCCCETNWHNIHLLPHHFFGS